MRFTRHSSTRSQRRACSALVAAIVIALFLCFHYLLTSLRYITFLNSKEKTSPLLGIEKEPQIVEEPLTAPNGNGKITADKPLAKKKKQRKSPLVTHPPYNGTLQRVFQKYPQPLPCLPQFNDSKRPLSLYVYTRRDVSGGIDRVGMFYTKLSKCSSSTLAGIAVQIAKNEAKRRQAAGDATTPNECWVKADHGTYRHVVSQRDKRRSILWTFIREPASRQVSDFFHFHVSRRGADAHNDTLFQQESKQALILTNYMTGYYFFHQKGGSPKMSEEKVDFILNAYDFIGLVERYHESLVLLKMIYNLDLRDILYTSAKTSGGYDDGEFLLKCTWIQKSFVSPQMKTWFQNSTEWNEYAKDDILLYRVVDKSIDLTIDAFGREEVQRQVELLERALLYTDEICGPTAVYPCSADGKRLPSSETTCVAHDWACGHRCIETLDLSQFE